MSDKRKEDSERTARMQPVKKVVERWFSDDENDTKLSAKDKKAPKTKRWVKKGDLND